MDATKKPKGISLTTKILFGMVFGIIVGVVMNNLPQSDFMTEWLTEGIFKLGGQIFINLMKMLVVPVVLVSLVTGVCNLDDARKLGRVGIKTVVLYLFTTTLAITLALVISSILNVGSGTKLSSSTLSAQALAKDPSQADMLQKAVEAPPLMNTLLNIFPSNPFASLAEGNMLQIIVFAILLGTAMTLLGRPAKRVIVLFQDLNEIVMKLVSMMIQAAPYGVFCLVAALFAREGIDLIRQLLGYFLTVIGVLLVHLILSNGLLLTVLGKLNPIVFFRKMYPAMMFAFSTSSSNVSIPVVLETVEHKLGVKNSVASFVIPLGATINMDGTAIMQGVATVFIANVYGIDIGIAGYLMVILTATLASIGTAGVPSVGLITLAMVLKQVGLPAEGIGLIIGVDRILDMLRTAVNVTGDAAVSCLVAKTENSLDMTMYQDETTIE